VDAAPVTRRAPVYAAEVYGREDEEVLAQAWMLVQPEDVRRSYVRYVLRPPTK